MALRTAALTLLVVLACADVARAAIPTPAVSSAHGTVTPSLLAGVEAPLDGAGPGVVVDGFGLNPPALAATPGMDVAIAPDMPVSAVFAWLGRVPLPVAATGEGVYAVTLPADAALPAQLAVRLESITDTHRLSSSWIVDLVPAREPAVASAVLRGRRLAVTVACPAAGACAGTLTLTTPGLRVARLRFSGVPAGTRRTLRTTIRAAVRRDLERRRVRTLRTVLTARGGVPRMGEVQLSRGSAAQDCSRGRRPQGQCRSSPNTLR